MMQNSVIRNPVPTSGSGSRAAIGSTSGTDPSRYATYGLLSFLP